MNEHFPTENDATIYRIINYYKSENKVIYANCTRTQIAEKTALLAVPLAYQ